MTGSSMKLVFVVARARNGIIGRDGALPWRLPSELKRFKSTTWGRPMIMGRKTFQSIGRPLPGRDTIVVTRDAGFAAQGVDVARAIDEAVRMGELRARARGVDEIMVVGGAEIYAALADRADRIVLTEVNLAPQGDAVFATPDPAVWRRVSTETVEPAPGDEAAYAVHVYERLTPNPPPH